MPYQISIVVAVFNEEKALPLFLDELLRTIGNMSIEILLVNDGSSDDSLAIAEKYAEVNTAIKIISFSRNFGHEAAMIAGIDYATGDAIICMDSDLQHPPALIQKMHAQFLLGYEIVNMVRIDREDASWWKKISSSFFYFFLNKITPIQFEPNASDFFLISKRVGNILKTDYREKARFLRGFIQSVGFKKTTIDFIAPERIAGNSKYSFFKLVSFSISAIVSFSKIPLRLGIIIGFVFAFFSLIVGIYSLIMKFFDNPVSGYTTIVVLISFMFSVLFIVVGFIGEYLGFVFDEIKNRPIYIVDKTSISNEPPK